MQRRGRPPAWTNEQREQVLALADEGESHRPIAKAVFGDTRYRGRVERILRAETISPRDSDRPPEAVSAEVEEAFEARDMTCVRELVARYERALLESEDAPAIADIDRLLKIKRQLQGMEQLERLRELTREHR